jgi:signal transduction histidine kinase
MDQQPVDLAQLLEEVHSRLKLLADSRSVELRLGPTELISILGDRERLRRLLMNLTDNAIKYTEPGGSVELSLQGDENWARVLVADTGIGIPLEEQEKIFQPFYRTDEARAQGENGTGLGLCIARSIAVAHDGAIQVESTPGLGSIFRVFIPVQKEMPSVRNF